MDKSVNVIKIKENCCSKEIPGLYTIYRAPTEKLRSLPPLLPKGKLHLLKPKLVQSHSIPEHKRVKAPRFIPFEPYSCAISLITEPTTENVYIRKKHMDINTLVSQFYSKPIRKEETKSNIKLLNLNEEVETIKKLKEERDYFKNQFKAQAKVNSEIKSLLVAVVGEDFQTKVNTLKEDKLQLAKALLDSMDNLSTHTEKIELLSGQCEVWRSKFLASSVIIEKLASWKTDLTEKSDILVNEIVKMLKLTENLRLIQIEILKNLIFLANIKDFEMPSGDIITLTAQSLNITQQMVLKSCFGIPSDLNITNLNPYTETEKLCLQVLESLKNPTNDNDDTLRSIFHHTQSKYPN